MRMNEASSSVTVRRTVEASSPSVRSDASSSTRIARSAPSARARTREGRQSLCVTPGVGQYVESPLPSNERDAISGQELAQGDDHGVDLVIPVSALVVVRALLHLHRHAILGEHGLGKPTDQGKDDMDE